MSTRSPAPSVVPSFDEPAPWRDGRLPASERAQRLLRLMTPEEKVAQLVGLWAGGDEVGDGVAPPPGPDASGSSSWAEAIRHGLGQLTRPYGSAPVEPERGARSLLAAQQEIVAASRFGIPALVHEECLTGFTAWRATAYPTPLAWGATFDPELVQRMALGIGRSMRACGVHQGMGPVLDVTRDYRWGRTEETIGEDPYLVGTIAAAYIAGLEGAGIIATPKHFAGYSASRAGRNLAPVGMGPRELADVVLPPFEMALRLGGARSVMSSYNEIDGVPVTADEALLTDLLRERWGFEGTVVADYFAIRFLQTLHGLAADGPEAAVLALRAGVDVELPRADVYGPELVERVRAGGVEESLVDRATLRVLRQKIELGLLDDGWVAVPAGSERPDLDDAAGRAVALEIARESVVLLANDGVLPLAPGRQVALIGPVADDPLAMLGCYSFPVHVLARHPEVDSGVEISSLRAQLQQVVPGLAYAAGCSVTGSDTSGIEEAARLAAAAQVCVLAVGDRSGMFGRGTSGEGCDVASLRLPGVQTELVRAVLATGTPVVLVLLSGRPYAIEDDVAQAAAIVQAFFPGQLGARAIAEVLTGAVNPSGRLPVGVPREPGGQPGTYLVPPLGQRTQLSAVDPTPRFGFGHGLGYTTFTWTDAHQVGGEQAWSTDGRATDGRATDGWATDGWAGVQVTVHNTGPRRGTEVVQLYLHDPVAQTTRPVRRLIGYARVPLDPDRRARVTFRVPADLTAFTGRRGVQVVEPGDVELLLARSSTQVVAAVPLQLVGPEREPGPDRHLVPLVQVEETTD